MTELFWGVFKIMVGFWLSIKNCQVVEFWLPNMSVTIKSTVWRPSDNGNTDIKFIEPEVIVAFPVWFMPSTLMKTLERFIPEPESLYWALIMGWLSVIHESFTGWRFEIVGFSLSSSAIKGTFIVSPKPVRPITITPLYSPPIGGREYVALKYTVSSAVMEPKGTSVTLISFP